MLRVTELFLFIGLMTHIFLTLFTKVEESFNTQAIHDFLYHRTNWTNYDHKEFPGVVARTFVGPLAIATLISPLLPIVKYFGLNKTWMLLAARTALGISILTSFCGFCRCVEKRFGKRVALYLRLFTLSQFHFLFYASRPLPNIFAMFFGTSVPFDSFMWGRPVWPELEVMEFNIVKNKSHEYGVMPFWWYFTSAIPRALLLTTLLASLSIFACQRNQRLIIQTIIPACIFLLLFSFLPHKELRFVIYVIPLLNLSAAFFCDFVWQRSSTSTFYRMISPLLAFHIFINGLLTSQFVNVGVKNYPGADALIQLQSLNREMSTKHITLHIDNYCAETGISRFVQLYDSWEYNKTENLSPKELQRFDYLMFGIDNKNKFYNDLKNNNITVAHEEYLIIEGFHKIAWQEFPFPPWWPRLFTSVPYPIFEPKVVVLTRIQ
uniref:Mannosyltransferase n=1 Tax=Meloidogyne hapla TaxID=6305 RepID=A0A1I8B1U6_MELHA